jgi:two-component system cell cycle sensor histidine kinase/response regulator CckA
MVSKNCQAQPAAGAETILLVEDEDAVRKVSRQILQGKGYRVLEANCGLEALRLSDAHEGPIHLVMSDFVMPGMSGSETVAELVRRRPGIRVLFVSGDTQEAVVQRQIVDPSTVFLQKPFSIATLTESVRETLRRKLVEKV